MAAMTYEVLSSFAGGVGKATCKGAEITLDAALDPRSDAFNPAELLLAALAACMTKGVLRAAKMNDIEVGRIEVQVTGVRQDSPPRMQSIRYRLLVETDAPDRRLELIHKNVLKFGTITGTLAEATDLTGEIARFGQPH